MLPPWRGNFGPIFFRGIKASGVILCHFSPFLLAYWLLAPPSGEVLAEHWTEVGWFFGLIAFSPPLFLPSLPIYYWWRFDWVQFTAPESALLLTLFGGAIFILPASFAQVGLHGRYRAAFRALDAWRFALSNLRVYLEAWVLSLLVSAAAVASGPLLPWGLFWSYLVIPHAFMQALARWDTAPVRERFRRCRSIPVGLDTVRHDMS